MRRPRVALAVLAALAREALLVRPREGLDGLRLSHLLLFDIRETGNREAGDELLAAMGKVALPEEEYEALLVDAIVNGATPDN